RNRSSRGVRECRAGRLVNPGRGAVAAATCRRKRRVIEKLTHVPRNAGAKGLPMKAYRLHDFGGPAGLRLEDVPAPTLGPAEVLVRIRAVSLNYRDLLIAKGLYNPKLKFPITPVSDGAGEVVATGAEAKRYRPGERVMVCFSPAWIDGPPTDAASRF